MFVATFEGQFGDARFVEFAETFRDHAVVLFLGGARERQIETDFLRQLERDAAIFGGVGGGEEAGVSRFCMSSPSVWSTREFAPVCEKTSRNIVRSRPSAAPSPRPSASPAVLMFITMLTSAFTWAALPACRCKRICRRR